MGASQICVAVGASVKWGSRSSPLRRDPAPQVGRYARKILDVRLFEDDDGGRKLLRTTLILPEGRRAAGETNGPIDG